MCIFAERSHEQKYISVFYICICKYTPGLSRCIFTRGCIFAHVQINFYIYAIAFTCPKIHPGANYTYMYNIHPVCKSAHVNGALDVTLRCAEVTYNLYDLEAGLHHVKIFKFMLSCPQYHIRGMFNKYTEKVSWFVLIISTWNSMILKYAGKSNLHLCTKCTMIHLFLLL